MSLSGGTKLGAYEITGQLGAGGMGEVYRATDTKLGRDVAIKTLPAALASDKDRLARFEREAKLLAALNHPHIAAVYSLDEDEGTLYLAMEFIEGETLEEKLKPGALPVEDALRLALQIAEALEAAHEKGVVHRDLKPANVMVTADGIVKVLDFGLAKAFSEDPNESNVAQSPALSVAMTQQGLVLGTAGYMSPEQASGQPTDQRADIWAFGVVLYEMLTGLPLFSGESVPHILADVLKTEPDWDRLPAGIHPRLRLMLERCLTKKPRNRYHSIADARVDIQDILSDPNGVTLHEPRQLGPNMALWRRALAPAVSLVAGAAIVGVLALILEPEPEPKLVTKFTYSLPEGSTFPGATRPIIALSPSGDQIAFGADGALWVRPIGELDAQPLTQTQNRNPRNPVFSPDAEWIAYTENNETLWRISPTGGSPERLTNITNSVGLNWGDDDTILFAQGASVVRVPASGGAPELIVAADGGRLRHPSILPSGLHVLAEYEASNETDVVVLDIESGEFTRLFAGMAPSYLETGHIVYFDAGNIDARAFDPATLDAGPPVTLEEGVWGGPRADAPQYALAPSGTLAYIEGAGGSASEARRLARIDPAENLVEPLAVESRNYRSLSVSPDGTQVALIIADEGGQDLWLYELSGDNEMRQLTFDGVSNDPSWWDNDTILFASARNGTPAIYQQRIDGGTVEQVSFPKERMGHYQPTGTPDGRLAFVVNTSDPDAADDIFVMDLPDGEPDLLIGGAGNQRLLSFSPDGDAMAYTDFRGDRPVIFVLPYPLSNDTPIRVSDDRVNAGVPRWSKDPGNPRLYYRVINGTILEAVDVTIAQRAYASRRQLFAGVTGGDFAFVADSLPGTDALLAIVPQTGDTQNAGAPERRIVVIENWAEKLRERVRTD